MSTMNATNETSSAKVAWATGGTLFAGMVMILSGIFQFIEGIGAIAKNQIFLGTPNYAFRFNVQSWGWIHVILGVLVAAVGYFVIAGALWARMVAMFIVAVQMFASFFFLPYYPIWALIVIALDVFVLWALAHAPVREI